VPTYQYACTACGEQHEAVQSFTDAPLADCPACGGRLRKVFSAVGVVFKGSGFYKTDSRSGAKAGSKDGGKDGGGGGDKDGGTGEGAAAKADGGAKPDAAAAKKKKDSAPAAGSASTSSTPAAKTA
jgi:putative FmdB family regulatory protein